MKTTTAVRSERSRGEEEGADAVAAPEEAPQLEDEDGPKLPEAHVAGHDASPPSMR